MLADSAEWFEIASDLEFNLLTDINMSKAKSIESFEVKRYENALFMQSPIRLKLYKNRAIILCVKRIIQFRKPQALWARPIQMSYKISVISILSR